MMLSSLRSTAQEYKKTINRSSSIGDHCLCFSHTLRSFAQYDRDMAGDRQKQHWNSKKNGSFSAVDNEGMAVSGKYMRLKDGRVKFEILHGDASVEIVILNVSVNGEELTVTGDVPGDVERYRRMDR
nr:hypothetical protein [uncultured Desulfobacter sp.]